MTKYTWSFTRVYCNLCENTNNLVWHDKDETTHLCKECYHKETDVYADENTVGYMG
jgi:hypothetical protein